MPVLHLITCEYPPQIGGVSEHSRVIAEAAASAGFDVQVWTGAEGDDAPHVHVHSTLRGFSRAAFGATDAALDQCPSPRRLIVQWVPHGYGRKGLNVAFGHWIRRRARAGDSVDVIVHEPFVDFFGGSWRQPFAALIQRYMTWTMMRAAARVWLTIPGWEPRLRPYAGAQVSTTHTLPVPSTIPPVRAAANVAELRQRLLQGRTRLVGYFGAGGTYAFDAIHSSVGELARQDTALVCIGRGSDVMAGELRAALGSSIAVSGTGALQRDDVSLHLQACDALLQPYPDGVSGRRTTTISALQHGVPVATTIGWLSEEFWKDTKAVEGVSASAPTTLGSAVLRLLEPARNAAARASAVELYEERFDPKRTMGALLSAGSC
jgi:glycosyltransferase involved in cell wall biosynthesis